MLRLSWQDGFPLFIRSHAQKLSELKQRGTQRNPFWNDRDTEKERRVVQFRRYAFLSMSDNKLHALRDRLEPFP